MTDNADNGEIPKVTPKNSNLKSFFDSKGSKPIPEHYFRETDDEPTSPSSAEDRSGILFKAGAIKLAEDEEKIGNAILATPITGPLGASTPVGEGRLGKYEDTYEFTMNSELMRGRDNKPIRLKFKFGSATDAVELGIDTVFNLTVGTHLDQETEQAYEDYAKREPQKAGNATTDFYFTKGGIYKKVSRIPRGVAVNFTRQHLKFHPEWVVNVYESEMTPGDFETAGRALKVIKEQFGIQEPEEEDDAPASE